MNDLISRQAAIKLLEEWANGYSYLEVPVSSIEPKLNELPPAEKKGKWLHPYQSHIASECSVCHMQMPISDYFYFCPHCGARMEEI